MKSDIKNILKEFNYSDKTEALRELKILVVANINKNDFIAAQYYNNKLLLINSESYESNRDKAFISYNLHDLTTSEEFINKALQINNKEVFGLNIYSLIQISYNNYENAIIALRKAIKIDRKYIDSYNNLGTCLFKIEKIAEAFNNFKKAYKLNKNNTNTLINIGNILSLNDKYTQAINLFNKALNILPDNVNILTNIAICYCRKRDIVNAEKIFNKLKEASVNSHELNYIFSTTLLNLGYFEKAWPLFESRLHLENKHKNFKKQRILNKIKISNAVDLNKDRLLILREQGIGEEILFSSLYKKIIDINENIKIESDKRLVDIFKRSFKKNVFYEEGYFSSKESNAKKFDKVIYAGSLCKYFLNNKENFLNKKYLLPENKLKKKFERYFSNNEKIKIGLSWKSKISIYGSLKSIKISDLDLLFKNNRDFFSLQYGDINEEKNKFLNNDKKLKFFDDVDLFNDLDSLMGILSNLDVFITVSNSTAHIAAAMGVRTIVICPKKSSTYFYWNYVKGESFWYNNVTVLSLEESVEKTVSKIDKMI